MIGIIHAVLASLNALVILTGIMRMFVIEPREVWATLFLTTVNAICFLWNIYEAKKSLA